MNARTKMGVGFDYADAEYKRFNFRQGEGLEASQILSHRLIFYLTYGHLPEFIDHIDVDKLNNHPSNLREATLSQNAVNRKKVTGCSSKFIGVNWHKGVSKWCASIQINKKRNHLGVFDCEREAASHYNLAAIEMHGAFATLNNIS